MMPLEFISPISSRISAFTEELLRCINYPAHGVAAVAGTNSFGEASSQATA
jgi:hypothetical protein